MARQQRGAVLGHKKVKQMGFAGSGIPMDRQPPARPVLRALQPCERLCIGLAAQKTLRRISCPVGK
jgi:hypothetical protein